MEVLDDIKKINKKSETRIPNGWRKVKLKDAVKFLDGKRKPIKESDRQKMSGDIPYYGASGIIDYINDYIFDDELILLGEDGANILNRSSRLAFKVQGKIWVNNHAHVLKPNESFDIDFLNDYLESLDYRKYNTSLSQPKLNKAECEKILILAPPHNEQKKIGQILSTWDQATEKTQRLIDQLELRKKGLMQELLNGKKRLPGYNGNWQEVTLGAITERITTKNEELDDTVVTISAQRGFVRQEDFFKKRVASSTLSGYYLIKKGDFAYNKSYSNGYPMGAFKRLDDFEKAVVTTLYICFSVKDNVDSDYLVNYFEGGLLVRNLTRIAQEGGRAHGLLNIGISDFFDLKLTLPPKDEQVAISSVLNSVDDEIKLYQANLEQLKKQKKGVMQQLLTGKKRVKT